MHRAAILPAVGQPLEVHDDVEVDPPKAGEIRIRMTASGVCHSDLSMREGTLLGVTPIVLGHEGAAVVQEVGDGVTDVAPGDSVVVSWVPQCGQCFWCRRDQGQLCQAASTSMAGGGLLDGTPRFRWREGPLYQMTASGTFSEISVIPAIGAVKVPADLDPTVAALLGCSVLTGVGAALNTAVIRSGDSVAVVGCGGVGLNVIQGARIAGAGRIIAVDTNPVKLELARRLGATDTVEAADTDPVSGVMGLTDERGADVAFEVIGTGPTIDQTIAMTRRGGQAVLVGIPSLDVVVSIPAFFGLVLAEKTVKGCWYGSSNVHRDVPKLVELYRSGQLELDSLVSREITLDEVDSALDEMGTGDLARSVVVY